MASMQKLLQPGTTCDDLLSCMFDLNRAEGGLYLLLVREGGLKLDELAKLAQRERSTVYRCLAKLVSLGLVDKESETLPGGGYYHIYTALSPQHLQEVVKNRLKEFSLRMDELLEDFDVQLTRAAQEFRC